MSKSSRRHNIADALRDIRSAGRQLARAEANLEEQSAGIRGTSYEGSSKPYVPDEVDRRFGRAIVTDATGDAAITVDACRAAERRLDKATARLARAAAELEACVSQAIAVATPTTEELAELEAKAEPGCEVVGRITRPNGPPYWEPIHTTTDYRGLLPRPYALGAWADMFVRRNGRLPLEHEVIAHCEGRRVMIKATA